MPYHLGTLGGVWRGTPYPLVLVIAASVHTSLVVIAIPVCSSRLNLTVAVGWASVIVGYRSHIVHPG